jgi:hypothetical protein
LAHKRRKQQAQFPARRWRESAGFRCPMSRATIDDQKDFARRVLDQAFPEYDQEFDESGRAAAPSKLRIDSFG